MANSAIDLANYYIGLLIIQYANKPKAQGTVKALVSPTLMPQTSVQTISFSASPVSGAFTLDWDGADTASINWNDSAATVQTKLRAIAGLGSVTVAGSIAGLALTVTFAGVIPPADLLVVSSSTLVATAGVVSVNVAGVDATLPTAVLNGFNLTGVSPALGTQLDVLGKYAGVSRVGYGFNGQAITLNDSDFLSLIKIAILVNSAKSDLASIQALFATNFPGGQVRVFDYQNMQMSYLISTAVGSQTLVQLFVTENLLPKPMGVALATVIYAANINAFFGYRTYSLPAYNASPYNDYPHYQIVWPWLSYSDSIYSSSNGNPSVQLYFGFRTYGAANALANPFNDYTSYQTGWPWISYT